MFEFGRYETATFTVRFTGEQLTRTGVHIQDLAVVLTSMNRMMNKAQLAYEGKFEKGAVPSKINRSLISLTIGERRRQSDAFAIVPMLLDPSAIQYTKQIADYVASGIVGYYTGNVLDRIKREKDEQKKLFIGSIHADVVNIIERVDAPGGLDTIQIGAPQSTESTVAVFDQENRDKIKALDNEFSLGKSQLIKGRVYRLYPNICMVTIRRAGKKKKKINVYLSETDFDLIRYDTEVDPLIIFTGHPRYKLGIETNLISEFEATSIEFAYKTNNQ